LDRARAGDTSFALRTLERATKIAPRYAPAHYQRGVLLSRSSSLGMSDILRRREANRSLKEAVELDAGNPLYLIELGRLRLKTPFLRLDAERLFNRALKAAIERGDPRMLADVRWELGLIHERRYVTMANRRVITNSAITFDPGAAIADWHYTADFLAQQSMPIEDAGEIDFRKAEEHFRAALASDPSHLGATVGLLGLLHDTERYEEMVSLVNALRGAQQNEPRLYMSMGLALHKLGRDLEAAYAFDTAQPLLSEAERREMLGLEKLLRKDDALDYATLPEGSRAELEALYWSLADPLRLTRENEARVEFLSRVTYADLRFSSPEFGVRGWRTDRGDIYIRYGPPPIIASLAPETQELANSDAIGRVITVWYYPASKLRFVFMGPPAMNVATFAGDFRSYAENTRFLAPARFDNLNSRLPVDSVGVQVARFRGERPGVTDVSIFADLPVGRMTRDMDVTQTQVETGLFITDGRRREIMAVQDSANIRLGAADAVSSRAWHRSLPPGDYLYRVEAQQLTNRRNARGMAAFNVGEFERGKLSLSDILVARRVAPRDPDAKPRVRSDLLIQPNGSLAFARNDTVFLFWETYGLTADSTGNARVKIDLALRVDELHRGEGIETRILGGLLDAVGLSAKGDQRVTLSYERTIPLDATDRAVDYLALDLGKAPNGSYTVEIAVHDLGTGRKATRQRVLTVRAP
ncbi:MAG: GWxTD domain-containing protein, partial [Gemmatimonadaceae bacterium]